MKLKFLYFCLIVLVSFLLGGCIIDSTQTRDEVTELRTTTKEEIKILSNDMKRLQLDVENLRAAMERQNTQQAEQIAAIKAYVKQIQENIEETNKKTIAQLKTTIDEVDRSRINDKKLLDDKMNAIIREFKSALQKLGAVSAATTSAAETITEKGFYHVVVEGESIWKIAQKYKAKYKVTVDDILKANNLTTESVIRPGQKLFIPIKE